MAIAMKDLEIRGAGNLLGGEQSGHIADVGFDLYVRLVGEAVSEFRQDGAGIEQPIEVKIELPIDAHLPHDYIRSERLRLEMYKRLAEVRTDEDVRLLHEELLDRYGTPPEPVDAAARGRQLPRPCPRRRNLRGHGPGQVRPVPPRRPARLARRTPQPAPPEEPLQGPRAYHAGAAATAVPASVPSRLVTRSCSPGPEQVIDGVIEPGVGRRPSAVRRPDREDPCREARGAGRAGCRRRPLPQRVRISCRPAPPRSSTAPDHQRSDVSELADAQCAGIEQAAESGQAEAGATRASSWSSSRWRC